MASKNDSSNHLGRCGQNRRCSCHGRTVKDVDLDIPWAIFPGERFGDALTELARFDDNEIMRQLVEREARSS